MNSIAHSPTITKARVISLPPLGGLDTALQYSRYTDAGRAIIRDYFADPLGPNPFNKPPSVFQRSDDHIGDYEMVRKYNAGQASRFVVIVERTPTPVPYYLIGPLVPRIAIRDWMTWNLLHSEEAGSMEGATERGRKMAQGYGFDFLPFNADEIEEVDYSQIPDPDWLHMAGEIDN